MTNQLLWGDKRLPQRLWEIKPVVEELSFLGSLETGLFDKCLAIVGSRKMTSYGEAVLEKFIPILVEAGVTIVSGFMYGVDRKAFDLTLECGGKTVAVLGWGIDWEKLPDRKGALFLSEYKGATKPQLWMFPRRNRIVAGLSHAVLVIEAGEGSGSLITANLAVRYKRPLFAIPGPITAKMSAGTNQLIQSGLAKMVLAPQDILSTMGWPIVSKSTASGSHPEADKNNTIEAVILKAVAYEPLVVDDIAKRTGLTPEQLAQTLSIMQLKDLIREVDGKISATC